jgi:hypothetical protein
VKRLLAFLAATLAVAGCSPEGWIAAFWPDDYPEARAVAWCESRLDPTAVSPDGSNHGLFQINVVHRDSFEAVTGRPWSTGRYEAAANSMFARWLYDGQGWGPWTCA